MILSQKDSDDNVQLSELPSPSSPPVAPPPPYNSEVASEQEESQTNATQIERRPSYPANTSYLPISNPLANTYQYEYTSHQYKPSERSLWAIAISVIFVSVLILYLRGTTGEEQRAPAKEQRHQHIPDGLAWTNLTPSERCLRFGTREYSAQLMGLPTGADGLQLCKEKEIMINGMDVKTPEYCTIDDPVSTNPRIYGHWTVGWNEPSCKTLWEDFKDKECVSAGSGTRRIEAHMGNHQPPWDNWREMCSTTPADYDGHHFDQPDSCDHRGIFWGIWGVWFIKDGSC